MSLFGLAFESANINMTEGNNGITLEDNIHSLKLKIQSSPTWAGPTCSCSRNSIQNAQSFVNMRNSAKYVVANKVEFQSMFLVTTTGQDFFVSFMKKNENDSRDYIIHVSFGKAGEAYVVKKEFNTDGMWHSVEKNITAKEDYIVEIDIKLAPLGVTYENMHKDTTYTDLELRGIDGSVHMHRIVAEAASPWFKTLFKGPWIEAGERLVNVDDATVSTLQQLKDYMYLGILPVTGDLTKLILMSSYYMMEDLEIRCSYEMSKQITDKNACNLLELAVKNNLCHLLFEILHVVQRKLVNVNEIQKFYKFN